MSAPATSVPLSDDERAFLDENGYVTLPGVLTPEEAADVRETVMALADAERDSDPSNVYLDGKSQRVWNLVNKDRVFERLIQHPRTLGAQEGLLGADCALSSFTANVIGPGSPAGGLHLDSPLTSLPTPLPQYALVANSVWLLDDFTEENGGTYVVPGSQRLGRAPTSDDRPEPVQVTGRAGSVTIIHGSIWHGSAPNRTDRHRVCLLGFHCRAVLKPQQDQMALASPDVLERATPVMRRLLGFDSQPGARA
jgi:hypothetical protein